ncbi:patatin-like phospholipase family protein [soil metagenome]
MIAEKIALTLPGGGARAAYQAGVLRGISDICKFKESPFQIISGISAGGINGMWLAAESEDFATATSKMVDSWKQLSVNDVYKTDAGTLLMTGIKWARNLSLGNVFGKSRINFLLDTAPLRSLLKKKINFTKIKANLDSGLLHGLSLSATDYHIGAGTTFFSGDKEIQAWKHTLSCGHRAELTVDHVLASAAIPIFFPMVEIDGRDYGDGGVGLKTPLSPAIHMGANRIFVIGVQNPRGGVTEKDAKKVERATLGDVAGEILNSLFLSSLDQDVERMQLLNRTVSIFTPEQIKADPDKLRRIPILVIRPSRDLSFIGEKEFEHFPFTIRYLLKGLGVNSKKGWDLLSYLSFDRVYTAALLDLGYEDAMAKREEIAEFFRESET